MPMAREFRTEVSKSSSCFDEGQDLPADRNPVAMTLTLEPT